MEEPDDDASKPAPRPPDLDAEQLLKMLELQRAARSVRPPERDNPFSGIALRYWMLAALVVGTMAAVLFLEWFASQIPRPAHPVGSLYASPTPPGAH